MTDLPVLEDAEKKLLKDGFVMHIWQKYVAELKAKGESKFTYSDLAMYVRDETVKRLQKLDLEVLKAHAAAHHKVASFEVKATSNEVVNAEIARDAVLKLAGLTEKDLEEVKR